MRMPHLSRLATWFTANSGQPAVFPLNTATDHKQSWTTTPGACGAIVDCVQSEKALNESNLLCCIVLADMTNISYLYIADLICRYDIHQYKTQYVLVKWCHRLHKWEFALGYNGFSRRGSLLRSAPDCRCRLAHNERLAPRLHLVIWGAA